MTSQTFGPAAGWGEIEKAVKAAHPLYLQPVEDIVYYDGPVVGLTRAPGDDRVYLYHSVDQTQVPINGSDMNGPCKLTRRTHYLGFPNEAAARATLHDGGIPTLESYRQSERIIVEDNAWTLLAPCKPADCQVTVAEVALADLPADDLPYGHLLPGGDVMEFTGATLDELEAACRDHYVWPLPEREQLYFWDCPRIWIGDTVSLGQTTVHLNVFAADLPDRGGDVTHRLSFKDEETLRATLYRGIAPTRATYEQATAIRREELIVGRAPDRLLTLRVTKVDLCHIPDTELPSAPLLPEAIGATA